MKSESSDKNKGNAPENLLRIVFWVQPGIYLIEIPSKLLKILRTNEINWTLKLWNKTWRSFGVWKINFNVIETTEDAIAVGVATSLLEIYEW